MTLGFTTKVQWNVIIVGHWSLPFICWKGTFRILYGSLQKKFSFSNNKVLCYWKFWAESDFLHHSWIWTFRKLSVDKNNQINGPLLTASSNSQNMTGNQFFSFTWVRTRKTAKAKNSWTEKKNFLCYDIAWSGYIILRHKIFLNVRKKSLSCINTITKLLFIPKPFLWFFEP